MKKTYFVAVARDGSITAKGYFSDEGTFLKYDLENPDQTEEIQDAENQNEEYKPESINEMIQRENVVVIHILDSSDAGGTQHLYVPPQPKWVTTVGWKGLTRTEAIVWTCLMISYQENKSEWVLHKDLENMLRFYRRSPDSLIKMIRSIRSKIADTKWHIQNYRGTGYRLTQIDIKIVAKNTYCNAHAAGEPKHKLATITAEATGLPAHRIRRWATKHKWINKNEKT